MRQTILFLAMIAPMSVHADEVKFIRKPTVKAVDGTFEVSFAVSQTTDVEVAIVDKGGRVVRHLTAGVIGGEVNPLPPLKTGLSQTLAWDGKDDDGKPAVRGPFTAQVRAGLTSKLGAMIANPAEINPSPHYNRLFGLATDEGGPIPIKAMDMAFDDQGRLYLYGQAGWREPIYRCDREFKPVPFPATGEPTTHLTLAEDSEGKRLPVYGRYGTGWSNKGIDIGPDGRIYVRCMYDWNKYFVTVFKPDGTAEKHDRIQGGILGPLSEGSGGIRIDRARFFYVGTDGFPAGTPNAHQWSSSIVKVKPDGGGIAQLPDPKEGEEPGRVDPERGIVFEDYLFDGAVTAYPRMSPRQDRGCVCKEARFDIDQFGRLYVPDVLQFCIHVYDNQGNWITDIGHYGNCDAMGNGSGPPIPFGWPMSCSINNAGRLYVADVLNHRVVRVDPLYAAEVACDVLASQ
ncbi:MAG: hypothetical protein H8E44_28375 [Planctomycetes bacterium]|nr:hypothetical protein [Planctomycetota bacterium]MBL7041588.1 hypothetical protein [Pirellulaceae bacterium]